MFAKQANFKPFSAIKGSERKQLLARIEKESELELDQDAKNKLVPKTVQSAKCILHSGKKAQLYTADGHPQWIVLDNALVPTVYTLSLVDDLVPTLYTVPNTLQYLQNGADFMVPGIFGDLPKKAPKGSVVQIKSLSGPVLAVGIALIDCSNVAEDKGKAVQVVNVRGDTLTPEAMLPKDAGLKEEQEQSTSSTSEDKKQDKDVPLTTDEADEAFSYAAQKVLESGFEYPMPSATFAKHLSDHFPYEHSELLIKNTSWKKLPKFLKHLEKDGLLTAKEQKGDTVIESVAEQFAALEVQEAPKTAPKKESKPRIECLQLFKVKSSGKSIVENTNLYYSASDLKGKINDYVSSNNLAKGAEVTIDDNLRTALGVKQDVTVLRREQVVQDFVKHSAAPHYQVRWPDQEPSKIIKGNIPQVSITTERKGGNKVVTKVSNVEAFGFDPKQLAEHLRIACAGSTTLSESKVGKAGGKPIITVQVQGNHVRKIGDYLVSQGLKSSWIKA